jgi:hypothetical protein
LKVAHPFPHPKINTTAVASNTGNTAMVRNFLRKEEPAKLSPEITLNPGVDLSLSLSI